MDVGLFYGPHPASAIGSSQFSLSFTSSMPISAPDRDRLRESRFLHGAPETAMHHLAKLLDVRVFDADELLSVDGDCACARLGLAISMWKRKPLAETPCVRVR